MPSLRKVKFESKTQAAIYIIGAINVFSMIPLGSMMLGLLMSFGFFYLILFPFSLWLWLGVVHRDALRMLLQIIILVCLIVDSLILTAVIPLIGLYNGVGDIFWSLMRIGYSQSMSSSIIGSWSFLPIFGVGPGFIVLSLFIMIQIYSIYYNSSWDKYSLIIMGPLTLILSIISLAIIILYWRSTR